MNAEAILVTLTAIVLASLLSWWLMLWARRFWRADHRTQEVRFLGAYSPLLTWCRKGWLALRDKGIEGLRPPPAPRPSDRSAGSENQPPDSVPSQPGSLPPRPRFRLKVSRLQLGAGLTLAVLLAARGQWALARSAITEGAVCYLAAALLFVAALYLADQEVVPGEMPRLRLGRFTAPAALWAASLLGLVLMANRFQSAPPGATRDWLIALFWLSSIATFVMGVLLAVGWRFRVPEGKAWLRQNGLEFALVAGLTLAALGVRIHALDQHPYPFLKDEGSAGAESLKLASGLVTNLLEPGWSHQPRTASLPTAVTIRLLGNTIFAVRLASALMGAFTVTLLYAFARLLFDRRVAFLAAGLLVALPPHVHFSRLGVTNIAVGFWAAGVLWLTFRAIRSGRVTAYCLAGLAAGLPLFTYLGCRLVLGLAIGILGYCCLVQRNYLRTYWRHLVVFGLATLIVAAPMILFFRRYPETFMAHISSNNIFLNGWLRAEPVNSGRTYTAIWLDQIARSVLVYVSHPAYGGFFDSPQPYLTALTAVLFVLGLADSLAHVNEPRHMLVQAWLWSIVIMGNLVNTTPPSSEKVVGSLPAVAVLVAWGFSRLAEAVKRLAIVPTPVLMAALIGVVVVSDWQGVSFYYGQYRQDRYFARYNEEVEQAVCRYLQPLGPNYHLYLITYPSVQKDSFSQAAYLIPGVEVTDLRTVTPEALQSLPRDKGAFFVATPERKPELEIVVQLFPGGQWLEVPRLPLPNHAPEMLYYAYQLTSAQIAGR